MQREQRLGEEEEQRLDEGKGKGWTRDMAKAEQGIGQRLGEGKGKGWARDLAKAGR